MYIPSFLKRSKPYPLLQIERARGNALYFFISLPTGNRPVLSFDINLMQLQRVSGSTFGYLRDLIASSSKEGWFMGDYSRISGYYGPSQAGGTVGGSVSAHSSA
jgi:hypothetical protein